MKLLEDNKCPRIIIHERSKGSDDESDDDEDGNRYSVTSWRKNFSSLKGFTSKIFTLINIYIKTKFTSESDFVQDQDADDGPEDDDEDEFVPDEI